MDNEIDRNIDVTASLFLLVQNWQQTNDWALIGSGANALGIQEWIGHWIPMFIGTPCIFLVYEEVIKGCFVVNQT